MIDQKLIDAHQWIVDESERKPSWWVEQTAWAYVAAEMTSVAINWDSGWDIILAALGLALGWAMISIARSEAHMASITANGNPWRMAFAALTAYYIVRLFMKPDVGLAATTLANVLLLSCHYFAACQPPRPRKRRQSVARSAA